MIISKNLKKVSKTDRIFDLIIENPYFLLMLEHFEIPLAVSDKTVEQICGENNLSLNLFLNIANLYNGQNSTMEVENTDKNLKDILKYLKKSHIYYENEKLPCIKKNISKLNSKTQKNHYKLVRQFFDEYVKEVREHLELESNVVFPYIENLLDKKADINYNIQQFVRNHSDIEEKLHDLKNLLIKYLPQYNDQQIRRHIIMQLYELEFDIYIHTKIEDEMLIPMVKFFEKNIKV